MNVLLLTYGTRGDVQPFVALGRALAKRGHAVTLATSTRFRAFAAQHGLAFAGLSDAMLQILERAEGKAIIESTRSILDSLSHAARHARRLGPILRDQLDDSWRAGQQAKPDLVVFHPKGFAGPTIAEHFDCPAVLALTFPMLIPTGERPHLGFPRLPFGAAYNRLTHHLVNLLAALAMKRPLRRFRATHDRPQAQRYDVRHSPDGRRLPSLTAVSAAVVPEPGDWPTTDRMIGYWFLDDEWPPSPELRAFVEGGPPPVYIGFGSMAGRDPERLTRVATRALEQCGARGVLATGWGGLAAARPHGSVLTVSTAPHHWLFARSAVVVHHGGAGTTAAALRAGVPSLVVPFMGDQPFWGERIRTLGVGPEMIPQKRLTVDRLVEGITTALTDSEMRQRAAALGTRLQRENGTAAACEWLEGLAAEFSEPLAR